MTSIFETVGYFGHRVQFSPFIDNMLFCVASSNTECILTNSQSLVKSSNYLLDINATASAATATACEQRQHLSQASSASSSSSSQEPKEHNFNQQTTTASASTRTAAFNSLPYCNHPSSTLPLSIQPNLPSASPVTSSSPSSSSSSGFLYILDHFIEDIANPLKCFRSFYWPFGGLIDATWLNENYLWSVSTDGLIQIWNLSSYLPIEDALSDLEPSPDPVKVLSGHSKVINCIDCNFIPSDSNLIVTSSADSCIKLWDAKTASLVKCINANANNTSNVTCSIPQFTPLHIPIVRSSASLASNVNFNTASHLQNVHPHRFTTSPSQVDQHHHHHHPHHQAHQNSFTSSPGHFTNHNQEQSSSLLQLLEHSHYFHQMDDSQSQGNLCSSSTSSSSPPSSSLSSPSSSSSTTDSAIDSPSSVSSSYPNTPPSSTAGSDHCGGDHRSPGLLQSLLQSSPFLHPHRHAVHLPNLVNIDIPFVSWSPLISSTFASCSTDGQVRVWSSKGPTDHRANLTFSTESTNLTSCDWNKYNEYLLAVSSTNGTISIWDIRSTNAGPVTVINGHKKSVKQVKFSPHSPYQLASVSCDATTKIWSLDAKDNHYFHEQQMHPGKSSYNGSDRSMAGSLVNTYRHHSDHVYGFDFNPSIKDRVVDCGHDSLVCLYSIAPSLNHLSIHGKAPKVANSPLKLNSTSTNRTPASDVSHSFSLFSTAT